MKPLESPLNRKIIHCDMDAFYASVEQRDRPELRGKPVVVGGDPQGRGVVAACSYEARKYGIRSAMSCAKAFRLCPQTIFVRPRFSKYQEVSQQVHEIFHTVTPWVESLSLDEAYLDVTTNLLNEPRASRLAMYLKRKIFEVTGLTASAGVGPNKFIAKVATDIRKPNGLTVIQPHEVESFLEKLPVEKMWGVGPVTTKRLHSLGLMTAGDIRKTSIQTLEQSLGKFGVFLHELSRGQDDRPVEPYSEPKSRGSETTFDQDIVDLDVLLSVLRELAEEVEAGLKEIERSAKTVTLKVKYADFQRVSRSQTLINPVEGADQIYQIASQLLVQATEAGHRPIRLLGISLGNLISPDEPLQLWLDFPVR